jgi:isopenicillin N synthase-like dioxygenase
MATSFQDLPIIDFSRLEKSETKAQALSELRGAIFDVGFLYLVNTGLEVYRCPIF